MKVSGSIRTQILLWNSVTLAAILVLLGLVVRQMTARALYLSVENELSHRVGPIVDGRPNRPDMGPPPGPPPGGRGGRQRINPLMHRFSLDGQCMPGEGDGCAPWDASAFATTEPRTFHYTSVTIEGQPFRVLTVLFPFQGPPRGFVQVPYPMADIERSLKAIDSTLVLLLPLALIVSALGAWAMSGRMLAPVRAISSAAERIGAGNLGERVPVRGSDEFAALGRTINAMLGRLEDASRRQAALIEQQRRFTADASHELKTPLTTIKANAQLALSQDTGDAYRHSMGEVSRAAADMDRLVQDLLLLARSDSGQLARNRIELLVSEVVGGAIERTHQAGRAPVRVEIQDDALTVMGNEGELVRLLANLLDNARKHSPPDREVVVQALEEKGAVRIDVIDRGPGLSPEHLKHLGERFFRADESRTRSDGGSGLGLSICKSIADAHGGTLEFMSELGKSFTASLRLPKDLSK